MDYQVSATAFRCFLTGVTNLLLLRTEPAPNLAAAELLRPALPMPIDANGSESSLLKL